MHAPLSSAKTSASGPGMAEFVALIAVLMGITALGIDFLLPAFPPIQAAYAIADPNDLQMLVYCYMLGFAVMQLAYGPASDSLGRKPVLIAGLLLYLVGCAVSLVSQSFELLIAARVIQGMGAAAARVLSISIVRDRFGGRDMAQVMSFVMMVFIMVPIFAPALGGVVLLIGDWHLIFAAMFVLGVVVLVWTMVRLPETLHPEYRRPLSAGSILSAAAVTLSRRQALGYSLAMGLMMGCLMGYIGSSQQIFETEVYGLGPWFPLAFGIMALAMGVGAFANSRLVQKHGMRRLSHAALLAYVSIAFLLMTVSWLSDGRPHLYLFGGLLICLNFVLSLSMPNFNALCMEPLGAVAGTASSLIGFYTTLMGALLGMVVGQSFDGTTMPVTVGFFGLSLATLAVVLWTERGRLFRQGPDAAA